MNSQKSSKNNGKNTCLWEAGSFIGNQTRIELSCSESKLNVAQKYTQEQLGEIPYLHDDVYENVLKSAQEGFQELSSLSAEKRRSLLENLRQLLEDNRETFVETIVAEAGKPKSYAETEVDRGLSTLRYAIEESTRIAGEVVPLDVGKGIGKEAYTKKFPIGPVFGISPFNFPLNLVLHKLAPALASGCSLTLKPSPATPLTALSLAQLVKQAGFPAGSFNVVICRNELAQKFVESEAFQMFSFTGSDKVGWFLKQRAGKKKTLLELGGNAPCIVDKTANIQEAAKALAKGCYLYAGQICISTQKIFVHQDCETEFVEQLRHFVDEEVISGDPRNEKTVNGPLINRESLDRVSNWVHQASIDGGEILFGGDVFDQHHHIYQPTLIKNPPKTSKISCEEAFAPVATLQTFGEFSEALREANNSRYGLQAGVYTESLSHMKKAFHELEYGAVLINSIPGFRLDHMPYGGVKDSGQGREGVKYAMDEMLEPRLLVF